MDTSSFLERTRSEQLALAAQLRERLHLLHLAPEQVPRLLHLLPVQVLEYLVSSKGRLGKTAGCFSLLASEQSRARVSNLVPSPPEGGSPGLRDFGAVARAGQQGTSSHNASSRPSPASFWDTTPGRRASEALGRLQVEREQGRKEAVSKKEGEESTNPGGKEEENGAQERETQKDKKRRRWIVQEEKENLKEKKKQETEGQDIAMSWRRSVSIAPRKSVIPLLLVL